MQNVTAGREPTAANSGLAQCLIWGRQKV